MFACGPALFASSGPGDPFFSNVVWGTDFDGVNGSVVFTDWSSYARGVFQFQTTVDTANAEFGTGAGFFNGNHYLQTSDAPELRLDTSDFTLEVSVKPSALTSNGILFQKAINNGFYPWQLVLQSSGVFLFRGFDNVGPTLIYSISGGLATIGSWSQVAATRRGNLFVLWVGGIAVASVTLGGGAVTLFSDTGGVYTGETGAFSAPITGYEDELRITNVCRYGGVSGTDPYTPATAAFPHHA